ncbi:uncharacterized protein LOC144582822 [Callithrix jacchus]
MYGGDCGGSGCFCGPSGRNASIPPGYPILPIAYSKPQGKEGAKEPAPLELLGHSSGELPWRPQERGLRAPLHSRLCSLSKMLFWHNQPAHPWPGAGDLYPAPPSSLLREPLLLPYLKQEELPNIPGMEPPCPMFQYVLCAATSPAVKQQEETLTYLNQGQSYEVWTLCSSKLCDATQ